MSLPYSNPKIRAGDTIVMYGDSITSPAYVYWQGFRDSVDAHFSGLGAAACTWVNQGVSGSGLTTGTAELMGSDASVAARITPSNPHCLFIELGINDVILGSSFDPVVWYNAMVGLVNKALAACSNLSKERILISSPWMWGEPTGAAETKINQILLAGMDAAYALGVAYLDQRTTRVRTGGETVDTIHPTTQGKGHLCTKLIAITTLSP